MSIQQKLKNAPAGPGVYLMKNAENRVIYVGKAAYLKKRLQSYFSKAAHIDPKTSVMVNRIATFDIILACSEKEALILESNLIKQHKPRYNVILKDDKRYPCLRIDVRQPYPKLAIVRKIKKDGAVYFGPFASAGAVRQTVGIVNKTFKLRKCSDREFKQRTRPCLHYQMQRCLAPCCLAVDTSVYRELIHEVVFFLNGRTPDLINRLKEEMHQEAESRNYEKAAELRDKIFALEKTLEKQIAVSTDLKDRDVIAVMISEGYTIFIMLIVRGGFLLGKRQFVFKTTIASENEAMGSFMRQFYEQAYLIPKEILVSHYPENRDLIAEMLGNIRHGKVKIHQPQRGEKRRLVHIAEENTGSGLSQLLASKASEMALLGRLKDRLKLELAPMRIECFDNSHLHGSMAVSGMVVFEEGMPKKDSYRTYKLRFADMHDDYAAMAEVLRRRYEKASEDLLLPDLLIVDGGKGQLNIAKAVLDDLGLSGAFGLIGIAKKDEKKGETRDKVYQPGRSNPISFGRDLDLLLFLQRIRDEAHRFTIAFHRKQRKKQWIHSALDDIPGVGKKRKTLILKHFRSVRSVKKASIEELASLPGINLKIARAVKERLAD